MIPLARVRGEERETEKTGNKSVLRFDGPLERAMPNWQQHGRDGREARPLHRRKRSGINISTTSKGSSNLFPSPLCNFHALLRSPLRLALSYRSLVHFWCTECRGVYFWGETHSESGVV